MEIDDNNKATELLRAVDLFAYPEIWEGGDHWRETRHTVPDLDGAGGSVDFLKLRPVDVERVKALLTGGANGTYGTADRGVHGDRREGDEELLVNPPPWQSPGSHVVGCHV